MMQIMTHHAHLLHAHAAIYIMCKCIMQIERERGRDIDGGERDHVHDATNVYSL
jgi:hypothetical protein